MSMSLRFVALKCKRNAIQPNGVSSVNTTSYIFVSGAKSSDVEIFIGGASTHIGAWSEGWCRRWESNPHGG